MDKQKAETFAAFCAQDYSSAPKLENNYGTVCQPQDAPPGSYKVDD